MRFECTGKISGNGKYTLTFVHTGGRDAMKMGALKVFKRDELVAEVSNEGIINAAGNNLSYTFVIDTFEAGTPFFVEVEAYGDKGNDINGLVFIKKQ